MASSTLEDPEYYKSKKHSKINNDIEDIYREWDALVPAEQLLPLDSVVYPIPGDPEECGALVFAAGSLARCVLVVEKESVFRCAHTYAPEPLTARPA